jgi:lipopolysaccharide/colanic/teichoic acid biosynthesis glycosyltransferase
LRSSDAAGKGRVIDLRQYRGDPSQGGTCGTYGDDGFQQRLSGAIAKRGFDLVVAGVLVILLAPLFLAVAVAVKLDSRGPVFFRARRIGYRGSELSMLKFRKMYDDADGPPLTAAEDDRFTRIGRLLAATKLDELPQLWNVVKGDMSLVGPRPEDAAFVAMHESYSRILQVKPGITGLSQLAFAKESQVLGNEGVLDSYVSRLLPAKMGLDEYYVANRSLWLDVRILVWTAVAVLLRRDVAVNRATAALTLRRRPAPAAQPASLGRLSIEVVEEP